MISIKDFSPDEWGMYFRGTYTVCRRNNKLYACKILEFTGDGDVVVSLSNDREAIVSIDTILWEGLKRSKTIKRGSYLLYIGPAGARGTKKPPCTANTMAIGYHAGLNSPVFFGPRTRAGKISSDMLLSYLTPDDKYPTTERELEKCLGKDSVVVLSPDTGIYREGLSKWTMIWRGVPVRKGLSCPATILKAKREVES